MKDPTRWVDTSKINHVAIMERYVSALAKENAGTHGGVYKRPCHFKKTCGGQGNDRLQLYPHRPPMGSRDEHGNDMYDAGPCFWCSVCGQSGSILQFLALSEGLDWDIPADRAQILSIAGLIPADVHKWDGKPYQGLAVKWIEDPIEEPKEAWSARALQFCRDARSYLWSDEPEALRVRAWLRGVRGLDEQTIHRAGLGYHAKREIQAYQEWELIEEEKTRWIPRGLVIPWMIDGRLWQVQIRLEDEDIQRALDKARQSGHSNYKPARYLPIYGGKFGLYRVNTIRVGQPLFIVESVLDALRGVQDSSYAWVATGSTSYGHNPRWLQAIAQASPVFLAYDFDEAGDKAYTSFWRRQNSKPFRWLPWAKDVSEMPRQDIAIWAEAGLAMVKALEAPPIPTEDAVALFTTKREPLPVQIPSDLPAGQRALPCHLAQYGLCTNYVIEQDESTWRMSADGCMFCLECWESRRLAMAGRALPWLLDRGLPTDLETRIQQFITARGCAGCGGHEWTIDELTGALVCPCVLKKRAETAKREQERAQAERDRKMILSGRRNQSSVIKEPALTHKVRL